MQKSNTISTYIHKRIKSNGELHQIKFIDYLDKNGKQEDAKCTLVNFIRKNKDNQQFQFEEYDDLKVLLRLCNKYTCYLFSTKSVKKDDDDDNINNNILEILEFARELYNIIDYKQDKDLIKLRIALYNNIAIYCMRIDDTKVAIKFLKNCINTDYSIDDCLKCVIYNNISSIHLIDKNHYKAYNYAKRSVFIIESQVFGMLKAGRKLSTLKQDEIFLNKLNLLIQGYYNLGLAAERYHNSNDMITLKDNEIKQRHPKEYFQNGVKLSKKFNGEDHPFTLQLIKCYNRVDKLILKDVSTLIVMSDECPDEKSTMQKRLNRMLEITQPEDSFKMPTELANFKDSRTNSLTSPSFKMRGKNFIIRKTSAPFFFASQSVNNKNVRTVSEDYSIDIQETQSGYLTLDSNRRLEKGALRTSTNNNLDRKALIDHGDLVNYNLQLLLKQQKDLEAKLTKKIEENSKGQNLSDDKAILLETKLKELEMKTELLKRENDKILQAKIEKDIEVERLRSIIFKSNETIPYNPIILPSSGFMPPLPIQTQSPLIIPAPIVGNIPQIKASNSPMERYDNGNKMLNFEEPGFVFNTQENLDLISPHNRMTTSQINMKLGMNPTPIQENPLIQNKPTLVPNPVTSSQLNPQYMRNPSISNSVMDRSQIFSANVSRIEQKEPLGRYSDPRKRQFKLDLSTLDTKTNTENDLNIRKTVQIEDKEPKLLRANQMSRSTALTSTNGLNSTLNKSTVQKITQLSKNAINLNESLNKTKIIFPANSGSGSKQSQQQQQQQHQQNQQQQIPQQLQQQQQQLQQNQSQQQQQQFPYSKLSNIVIEDDSKLNTELDNDPKQLNKLSNESRTTMRMSNTDSNISAAKFLGQNEFFLCPRQATFNKRIFLEDNYNYTIELNWNQLDDNNSTKTIQILLLQQALTNEKQKFILSEVSFDLEGLKKILRHVDYKDILPVTMPLKNLKNFSQFIKYMIFPFLGINYDPDGSKKIEMWAKAEGLFSQVPSIIFLGENCLVNYIHLINEDFRINLTSMQTGETIRIDMSLDTITIKKFFEKILGTKNNDYENIIRLIDTIDDGEQDNLIIQDMLSYFNKINDLNIKKEEEFENFKLIDKGFINIMEKVIKEIDLYLQDKNMTFVTAKDESSHKYFKLNITNEFKKVSFIFIKENLEKKVFEISVKNFFESHAPNNKKIKACGNKEYKFDNVWKEFGLRYDKISKSDKLAVCYLLAKSFTLDIHESPLEIDDYEIYEENPIRQIFLQCGAYHRIFVGDKFKFPMTLALTGLNDKLIGIKITLYNATQCAEWGMFIFINEALWKKNDQMNEQQQKKKKKYLAALPIIEDYTLEYVLSKIGWSIINSMINIQFNTKKNIYEIIGIKTIAGNSYIEQLENIIQPNSVINYFKDAKADYY